MLEIKFQFENFIFRDKNIFKLSEIKIFIKK